MIILYNAKDCKVFVPEICCLLITELISKVNLSPFDRAMYPSRNLPHLCLEYLKERSPVELAGVTIGSEVGSYSGSFDAKTIPLGVR